MSNFITKQSIWLKDLDPSVGTDKVLSIKADGQITQSNKTLDEIGVISTLQQVTDEGNTTDNDILLSRSGQQVPDIKLEITQNGQTNTIEADRSTVKDNFNNSTEVSSGQVKFTDAASGFTSIVKRPVTMTGSHIHTFQDKSGDVAHLDDITTPNLQDVTTEGGTTNKAVTVNNTLTSSSLQVNGTATANNFVTATGQVSGQVIKAVGANPVIQINDTDAGSGNIEIRPHAGSYDIDVTTPTQDGQLALVSDIPDASTTSYNFGGIVSWFPAPGGKTTLQLGNSNLHNVNFYAGNISFANTTGDNLISLANDNYAYGYTILTSNSLTQNESLTLPNGSGNLSLIRTINTSTPQTTATLNASFPNAEIGARVVNLDTTERYTYTKINASLWRRSELMTDI